MGCPFGVGCTSQFTMNVTTSLSRVINHTAHRAGFLSFFDCGPSLSFCRRFVCWINFFPLESRESSRQSSSHSQSLTHPHSLTQITTIFASSTHQLSLPQCLSCLNVSVTANPRDGEALGAFFFLALHTTPLVYI